MSLALSARTYDPTAARGGLGRLSRRLIRLGLTTLGGVIVLAGVLIAPLPGPMGLPVATVGLILILRNSYKARRAFVRFQRAHPRALRPVRRLLRRRPEVLSVMWEMTLKTERLLVPRRYRVAIRGRRLFRRRRRASTIVA
ncbi:hypothetical protein [Phenylobacterium sp.]|uniref:hypothetical protein n=1 Tax=Phenylobacterium sp. TaxID=1871053 RepID=UPI002730739C|nr:hypothetical protein [Phenylobacterium sp.]MDP1874933.1 hypothetical protein [Phenylobacterium sp.]MDP3300062.1 hypothetical protein [Phenylobacterium sp.]MDP3491182.1 hypothetical protein [Phenylobacterium sp.]